MLLSLGCTGESPRELFKNQDFQAAAFIKTTRMGRDENQASVFIYFSIVQYIYIYIDELEND